ncbi:MAG: fumarylacetoacetate hydrolase family protein [Maritimibacter sp.]|jgi:2,4-diketo-3-deoxy-L-fuconate hydrolase|uniref:fumarylacetoacetate hydrolase family protein n=1 Tax=Maritimibacter sp. TaxID=2003363 RepID=UPI001D641DA3|nr:fumarylacetoacetate hydrolase family protein [Maritimibacter sp.]MBL6430250.1 fumarylacetoacetate hydrolase family protein [Maritimibacter sp.]
MSEYKLGMGHVDGVHTPLVLVGKDIYRLSDILKGQAPATLEEVFANWKAMDQTIGTSVVSPDASPLQADAVTFLTPLSNPRKVVCIGTNYHDHVEEMKVTSLPDFPYAFLRPQTCLAAHGEEVALPTGAKMNDWEAELGIVIGQAYGPGDTRDPMEAVAGYTVINDVSARDWIASRPFVGIDWVMQKAWDGFQPTGPWITPARFVEDPDNLDIELTVNGAVKQKSNTGNMIFGVAPILRHLAGIMTLEPGDIIATGTPAGVGYGQHPQEFLASGDTVKVTVAGLGTLENRFV